MTIDLYAAVRTTVAVGGTPTIAMYGPLDGGRVENPYSPVDQRIPTAEVLYICLTGDAGLVANESTFAIQPGSYFDIPTGTTTNVSVNAATSGHMFSAFASHESVPYVPPSGSFPPPGPTTITKTITSYLYQEYNDDEDLQAFVDWYNEKAQEYVGWFATVGLPVYTGPMIVGDLLDWIGAGLYGYTRPVLPGGSNRWRGPPNTFAPNVLAPNVLDKVGNEVVYVTTDDIYKRCLTWHLWKGDGKVFTIKWLKRRVVRFLTGIGGGPGTTDDTSIVSVAFSGNDQVNIRIGPGRRTVVGGSVPNIAYPNGSAPNQAKTTFVPGPYVPEAVIFKAAVDSGALELPFQFTYAVVVG